MTALHSQCLHASLLSLPSLPIIEKVAWGPPHVAGHARNLAFIYYGHEPGRGLYLPEQNDAVSLNKLMKLYQCYFQKKIV